LTFDVTGVADVVTLIHGDALQYLSAYKDIGFCFLDAEKQIYEQCYEAVVPSMVPGGLLLADNAISHRDALQPMLDRVLADDRVDALVVPIGSGVLVCRKR
jgi:predicted O-methyltransferase YrrM